MDIYAWFEELPAGQVSIGIGLVVGLIFGAFAQVMI